MKINGMGNVRKSDMLKAFSAEGRKAIKEGIITWEEAAHDYKEAAAQKLSKWGNYSLTYTDNRRNIPEDIADKLSPADIAALVDAFQSCYSAGKNSGQK